VDEFYNGVIVGGILRLGAAAAWLDEHFVDGLVNGAARLVRRVSSLSIVFDNQVVDGAVNGLGSIHKTLSAGLRRLQTGFVYNYALSIVIGIVVILSIVVTVF
jgi:NADH-quinone oxidoreductase subunit L